MSQFNDVENSVSSFDLAQVVTQQMSSNDTINNNNTQEYMADILVGILHEDLNDFLSDFWRVASLEYLAQLEASKTSWSNSVDYHTVLEAKQKKGLLLTLINILLLEWLLPNDKNLLTFK